MPILDRFDLTGRAAIVTGAGSNLGREMSLALAEAGADIVGVGRRPDPLEETGSMVREKGRRYLARPTDVTDSTAVNAMVADAIAEFGRIHVLVNNAGGGGAGRGKTLTELTDEDWHAGIDTNLTSAFFCSRAIVDHMVEQGGGRIINVTSGWGYRGQRHRYMYPIAKAGVISLTKALAMSYARDNVRASCIAPGSFPHEMTPEVENRSSLQPAGRLGRMEELGPLAVFLASDASDYLSAETVLIDGGAIAAGITPAGMVPVVAEEGV
jgi:NAD(P)-dependent dehydrogenase (short-subunit alcohol dehydrogenase family)